MEKKFFNSFNYNLMENFNNNLLPKNEFFPLNSFPINLNMFDNLPFIQYKGISIPRIPMERDNSINLVKIIYSFIDNIESNETGQNIEGNLCYLIGNINKENDIFNNIIKNINKKGRIKNHILNQKKENINKNNYLNSNEYKNNPNKTNNLIKKKNKS